MADGWRSSGGGDGVQVSGCGAASGWEVGDRGRAAAEEGRGGGKPADGARRSVSGHGDADEETVVGGAGGASAGVWNRGVGGWQRRGREAGEGAAACRQAGAGMQSAGGGCGGERRAGMATFEGEA